MLIGRLPHSLVAALLIAAAVRAELPPPIATLTADQVQAYAAEHRRGWEAQFRPHQSRLFLRAQDWERKKAEILSAGGRMAAYRLALKDAADRLAHSDVESYLPPEARMTPGASRMQMNEEGWQRGFGDRLVTLAFAYRIYGTPAYGRKLRELVLAGCAFPTWGAQGPNGELVDMDLAAGHMSRGIAVAYDWNRDLFSENDQQTIRAAMRAKVGHLMAGLYGKIFWSNWYSQNHNHVCVNGLGLAGLAFLDEIPEAADWLAGACLDFDRVCQSIAADGSCYEGLSYWSYGRSAIFQFIEGTRDVAGTAHLYDTPGLRNTASFRIGCSVPGLDGVIMWADSRGHDDLGPHHILYRLASEYHDAHAQYVADHLPFLPVGSGGDSLVWTLLWHDSLIPASPPTALDFHAPVWDVATSRSSWDASGYLLAVKAGINSQSHTHLDAGAIALNVAGGWALLSPGYGTQLGTPGFFDNAKHRWEFLSNSTQANCTLLIDGDNQRFDREAGGKIEHVVSAASTWWSEVDLTGAYAKVTAVRRRILHRRGDYILVLDTITAPSAVSAEWLAQVPPETSATRTRLSVVTPAFGLEVAALDHGDFQVRNPTAKIIDVDRARLQTFARPASGARLVYATLIRTSAPGTTRPDIGSSVSLVGTTKRVTLRAGAWTDEIAVSETGPVPLEQAGVTATATTLATREESGVQSVLAVAATALTLPAARLTFDQPTDLMLEKKGDDWAVSLPNAGSLAVADRRTDPLAAVHRLPSLPPGRYSLSALGQGKALLVTEPSPFAAAGSVLARPLVLLPAPAEALRGVGRPAVSWEAESEHAERFGAATVREDAAASGGKALLNVGTATPWHQITWRVRIPQTGAYYLAARYGLDQPSCALKLSVRLNSASTEAGDFFLAGPTGLNPEREWHLTTHGWKSSLAVDASDHPVEFALPAGNCELTISSPTCAINLDSFSLILATSARLR